MPCGRMDEETTCNFGLIEGGKATNIVADYCVVNGEARSLNRAKLDKLTDELINTFTATVEALGQNLKLKLSLYIRKLIWIKMMR